MLVVEESRDYGISAGEIKQFRQNMGLKELELCFLSSNRTFGLSQHVLKSVEMGPLRFSKLSKS